MPQIIICKKDYQMDTRILRLVKEAELGNLSSSGQLFTEEGFSQMGVPSDDGLIEWL